jgi:hypothetical protein
LSRLTAAVAALCVAALTAAPALAHEGDPDFESLVTDTGPTGLQVRVLSGDDRLEVRNDTGKVVVIEGYEEEPYARLLPDGQVQVNERSPAAYLNDDPRGDVDVPKAADPKAAPRWKTIESNGRFEFHDHRIHWMADGDPPVVREDRTARQKVFDWAVPVTVGSEAAAVTGTLWWRGSGGGPPIGAIIALAVTVLGGAALVIFVRRRRRGGDGHADPKAEAW